MTAAGGSLVSPSFALVDPPVPYYNKDNVEQVENHHRHRFPQMELAVDDEAHAKSCSHNKEANVTDEALAGDVEGADQGHGSRDYRSDEAGSTDQLAHSQTRCVCAKCSNGREDIWTAIAKRKQCHTRQTLAHAQHACDGVEVNAEEVAGGDADGAEEQGEPQGHHDECDRLRMRQTTIVEGQVGDDAGFLVGAVGEHEGALVGGMVDKAALWR